MASSAGVEPTSREMIAVATSKIRTNIVFLNLPQIVGDRGHPEACEP
jgi:hypothetical protein